MSEYSKVNQLIKNVKFVMVTFITEEGHLHAAPMTSQNNHEFNGVIWFIGSKQSELVKNIPHQPQVNLSYDLSSNNYISINGEAKLVTDQTKLDELWSSAYEAFFEKGKEDPNVQLIKVVTNGAQYWEGASTLATIYKLTKASITGESESLGTSETIKL